MEEVSLKIRNRLFDSFSYNDTEKEIIDEVLKSELNYPRVNTIISLILDMKLDKSSCLAFLVYQFYKNNNEKGEAMSKQLL